MSNFGRCCICTASFTIADVTTLKCGHTFHSECIKHWIESSKTCPHCRKKTILRDIIKLYFDEADVTFTQESSAGDVYADKLVEDLTLKLTEEKEQNRKLLVTFGEFQNIVKTLKSELKHEKSKNSTLNLKEDRIRTLEGMLSNQSIIESELQKSKARVKASNFFNYLTKKSGRDDENIIDDFLTDDGEVDTKKFIDLIEGQNRKLTGRIKQLEENLIAQKRLNLEKTGKLHHYKQLAVDLKHELDHLKAKFSLSVTKNEGALKDITNENENSTPMFQRSKKSFGFSYLEETLDKSELLRSAVRTTNARYANFDEEEECLIDEKFLAKDEMQAQTLSVESVDVPLASSVTTASSKVGSSKDAQQRKLVAPKRKLSNLDRSLVILEELECQTRNEKVSNHTKTRKPNSKTKNGSQKESGASSLQGIKRFLSDPDMRNSPIRPTTSKTLNHSTDSSDTSIIYASRRHDRISSNSTDVIDID